MSSAACMLMWPQSAAILVREFVCVGGVTDHIHIVTTLFRTVSQANLVEQIKKASSKWIKALDARYRGFFWQRGYGVFGEPESAESTCRRSESTIALAAFRRSIASYCVSTGSISTSGMFGIDHHPQN